MRFLWKVLCTLLLLIHAIVCNWWNLAIPKAVSQIGNNSLDTFTTLNKESCHRLEYLVERQKQLCTLSDKMIQVLQTGAKQAVDECQYQFRNSRWNCSTVENSTDIFGGVLKYKSRESAFVHALSSAALAHAVARACSRGELNECSCDSRVRKRTPRHWQWGGCSEDIRYGEMYSRDFVDSKEDKNTDEGLINLHNNEAGRRAVRSRMQRVCKCHGMSGSCSVRVCWRRLPQLRVVGDALSIRYDGASHVKVGMAERKRGKNIRKLRPVHTDMKKPNKTDLVYLEDSPDYCEPNDELGILGTRGRTCNRTSAGLDGCRLLCCGRGYQTRVRDHEEKCKCKFVWCCKVHCEICRYKKDHHVCN